MYETYGYHGDDVDEDELKEDNQPDETVHKEKDGGILGKQHRSLWCEMPEVKKSGLLETISGNELKLQEVIQGSARRNVHK